MVTHHQTTIWDNMELFPSIMAKQIQEFQQTSFFSEKKTPYQ